MASESFIPTLLLFFGLFLKISRRLPLMLHGTIATTIFGATQHYNKHYCDVVSNSCNIVPTLQRCVAQKIAVTNRPV